MAPRAKASAVEQGQAHGGKAAAATKHVWSIRTKLQIEGRARDLAVSEWIGSVGLDPRPFGTHSLRRTKATLIHRRTGNLRAVPLLLGDICVEMGSPVWVATTGDIPHGTNV